MSQSAFADLFGLNRNNVGSYEEGRAEPKLDVVLQIAKYFSLSLEEFVEKELTVNSFYHFDIVDKGVKKSKSTKVPMVIDGAYPETSRKLKFEAEGMQPDLICQMKNGELYLLKSVTEHDSGDYAFHDGNLILTDKKKNFSAVFKLIGKLNIQPNEVKADDKLQLLEKRCLELIEEVRSMKR